MYKKKGFTLIEVMIAIILSAIALFGIETLIIASFKDWKTSKEIVDLQRDLDTASYQIKGVLEEANADTIYTSGGTVSNTGIMIRAGNSGWLKEFYGSGNSLIYKDDLDNSTETIISTLQSITFTNGSDGRSVRVDLALVKNIQSQPQPRQLDNSFLVYLRNEGGG